MSYNYNISVPKFKDLEVMTRVRIFSTAFTSKLMRKRCRNFSEISSEVLPSSAQLELLEVYGICVHNQKYSHHNFLRNIFSPLHHSVESQYKGKFCEDSLKNVFNKFSIVGVSSVGITSRLKSLLGYSEIQYKSLVPESRLPWKHVHIFCK